MMVEAGLEGQPPGEERARMEFGILFTSHPNQDVEPYPRRDVHARVTREILRADQLGFDYAWLAEHHFSDQDGIMPDVFVYAGYPADLPRRRHRPVDCRGGAHGFWSPALDLDAV